MDKITQTCKIKHTVSRQIETKELLILLKEEINLANKVIAHIHCVIIYSYVCFTCLKFTSANYNPQNSTEKFSVCQTSISKMAAAV